MRQVQMYDAFGVDGNGTSRFLMRASLPTIAMFLHMHRDAERRVKTECEVPGAVAMVYHNFGRLAETKHAIQKAVTDLGTTKEIVS